MGCPLLLLEQGQGLLLAPGERGHPGADPGRRILFSAADHSVRPLSDKQRLEREQPGVAVASRQAERDGAGRLMLWQVVHGLDEPCNHRVGVVSRQPLTSREDGVEVAQTAAEQMSRGPARYDTTRSGQGRPHQAVWTRAIAGWSNDQNLWMGLGEVT